MVSALVVALVLVVTWVLVSRRLSRWSITAPITLMVAGYVLARVGGLEIGLKAEDLRTLSEVTLALVLFDDASRVRARQLRQDAALATRLLAVGLPLTMAAGTLGAGLLFAGHSWWVLALVGAILAPTDAALGASIMHEERIPERLRTLVNIESGLNDGLATPFVLFFLAGATAEEQGGSVHHVVVSAATEVLLALVVGVVLGTVGGRLVQAARVAEWSERGLEPLAVVALALLTYFFALEVGGNGFVSAFVGGLAFGNSARAHAHRQLELTDQLGTLLGLAVWFSFGVVAVLLMPFVTWQACVYAVLSLTVVRIGPVLIALWGSGLPRRDALLVGWLGPRGLASIVFAVLAVQALTGSDAELVGSVVTVTVVLSVLAHGLSAGPLARRYAAAQPR